MMKSLYTHYDNLGVSRNAPDEVIKAAYRTLSKIHHPDLNPGSPDSAKKMKSINESYDTLCNPQKRRLYDDWLRLQEITGGIKPENTAENSKWKPKPSFVYKKRAHSFRRTFILTTGLLFFSLILAITLYDPVMQNISDYITPGIKTVAASAGKTAGIKIPKDIDPESMEIPRGFPGEDIVGLFDRELTSFPPKDEFEKLDDYKTRFNTSAFHKRFFFKSAIARVASYDIDRQIISITFTGKSELNNIRPIIVESGKSSPAADKPGGVIPEITNYCLKDIRENPEIARYLTSDLSFRISPEEGRQLKKHLGILIIATPEVDTNGLAVSENHVNEYEIFYQLNRKINNRYVHSLINSVWVYNTETGSVHFKKNFPEPAGREYLSWVKINRLNADRIPQSMDAEYAVNKHKKTVPPAPDAGDNGTPPPAFNFPDSP